MSNVKTIIQNLKLKEQVFLVAGVLTLVAVPFLSMGGFYVWLVVKTVYLFGIIFLFFKK